MTSNQADITAAAAVPAARIAPEADATGTLPGSPFPLGLPRSAQAATCPTSHWSPGPPSCRDWTRLHRRPTPTPIKAADNTLRDEPGRHAPRAAGLVPLHNYAECDA